MRGRRRASIPPPRCVVGSRYPAGDRGESRRRRGNTPGSGCARARDPGVRAANRTGDAPGPARRGHRRLAPIAAPPAPSLCRRPRAAPPPRPGLPPLATPPPADVVHAPPPLPPSVAAARAVRRRTGGGSGASGRRFQRLDEHPPLLQRPDRRRAVIPPGDRIAQRTIEPV